MDFGSLSYELKRSPCKFNNISKKHQSHHQQQQHQRKTTFKCYAISIFNSRRPQYLSSVINSIQIFTLLHFVFSKLKFPIIIHVFKLLNLLFIFHLLVSFLKIFTYFKLFQSPKRKIWTLVCFRNLFLRESKRVDPTKIFHR